MKRYPELAPAIAGDRGGRSGQRRRTLDAGAMERGDAVQF
jgi:hypothetical protein